MTSENGSIPNKITMNSAPKSELISLNRFDSRDQMFKSLAVDCETRLKNTLIKNDKASFIVPGGTTPAPVFLELSKSDLEWEKITIAQSDERWLDSDHPQSNQRLTENTFLINNAAQAGYVAMKNSSVTASKALAQCNQDYHIISPFTVTMLGMGLDGHIASLFPNSNHIEEGLSLDNKDLCIDIDATGCPVAGEYTERMSLTLNAILASEQIILLITGDEKLKLVEHWLDKQPERSCPISFLLNQTKTPLAIYWAE